MDTPAIDQLAYWNSLKGKKPPGAPGKKILMERTCMDVEKSTQRISRKIRRVLNQIEAEYYNKLDLISLGQCVGLHPDYLCRKFKKEVGVSFHEFIQMTRVKKGAQQLVSSRKSIKEISHAVGFSRPEIFTRSFKRMTGFSPSEYRKKNKLKPV